MANELTVEINADDSGLQEGLGDLKQNLAIVGQSLMDLGSSIQEAFTGAIDGVFDAQKSMLKFQNQTGSTNAEMKKYAQEIKDIYKSDLGESLEDVSSAMANVQQQSKQLGVSSSKDLKTITEYAIILRDNFEVDIPESTKTAGNLIKNFGLTSKEAFDLIAKGFQDGLNQSDDFMDTLYEYSPQFAKIGLNANDMYNVLKSGSESGIFTLDKIGDAIKEFGIRAIDASDASKQAFEDIGLNADKTMKDFAKGGDSARTAFYKVLEGLNDIKDPIKQNEIGVALFGTMWEDLGAKAILALKDTNNYYSDTTNTLDKIKKNTAAKDIGSQFESLKRTIEVDIVQPLAEKLLPAIKSIADTANQYLPQVKKLFSEIPSSVIVVVAAIGGLAAVIIPLVGLFGILSPAITAVKVAIISAGTSIYALSTPILIAIGAIVAILAVIYIFRDQFKEVFNKIANVIMPVLTNAFNYLKTSFTTHILPIIEQQLPKIKASFMEAFESIKGHLSTVIPVIISIIKKCEPVFEVIVIVLKALWSAFTIVFTNVVQFLGSVISNIIQIIKGLIVVITGVINVGLGLITGDWNRVWEGIKMGLIGVFNIIKGVIYTALDYIKLVIGTALEIVLGIFNKIFPGIGNTVKDIWYKIKNFFTEGASSIKNTLNTTMQKLPEIVLDVAISLYTAGSKLIDQLISGIKAGIKKVKQVCSDVAQTISDFFPHSPAKEGALRLFPETGYSLMEQLMTGIEASQGKLNAITANVASDINGNINTSLNTTNGSSNQTGIVIPIYLDGKKISEVTAPYFVKALRQQGF